MHRQNLGEMLVAANLIDEVQMQIALAEQRQSGKRFGSTLVDLQFIDENVLAAFLSKQMDVPCISLLHIDIPKKVLRRMSREIAVRCNAIPVRIDDGGKLEVAMIDPTDIDTIVKLEEATAGRRPEEGCSAPRSFPSLPSAAARACAASAALRGSSRSRLDRRCTAPPLPDARSRASSSRRAARPALPSPSPCAPRAASAP